MAVGGGEAERESLFEGKNMALFEVTRAAQHGPVRGCAEGPAAGWTPCGRRVGREPGALAGLVARGSTA